MNQDKNVFPEKEICTPEEQCRRALLRTQAVTKGEQDLIANLANTAAVINTFLEDISWVGFYLIKEGQLVLGPFQGKAACKRIDLGKGVCGTSAKEGKTLIVEDVNEFPGHIACDSGSKSEIVLPVFHGMSVVAVLDIDSYSKARFGKTEAEWLKQIVEVLEKGCNWQ